MDFSVKHRPENGEEPVRVSAAEPEQQPFFEQLVEFFRHNALYFLIAGLILLIAQDIFGTHGVLAMRRSQVEAQQIREEIKRLDEENKRLEGETKDLQSNPATIEGHARANGLKRPDEIVFQLSPKQPDAAPAAHTDTKN